MPTVVLFPRLVPLVWLAVVAIPTNTPLSPVLPTAFEPVIMEAAKYEQALWVALVALGAYMYMEYLNWHVYSWALDWKRFAALRERRWVRRSVAYFARVPFITVVVFAFTPLPFWVARILAIFQHYPLGRFLTATALGRFPRLYLYAWLGEWLRVPTILLVAVLVGGAAVAVVGRLSRGEPILDRAAVRPSAVPDVGTDP